MIKPFVSLSEKTSKKKTIIFCCRAIHVIPEQLLSATLLTQGNHVSLSADTCALIDYQVKMHSALTLLHMNKLTLLNINKFVKISRFQKK